MLDAPFLTDLDSRAAVKGSRDPLGIQSIWTRFGRHVVGNLTTVSNSVRDFTTLLLGFWFAERIADQHGPGSELATFLKWEQLAAYARAGVNHDFAFRGTERVRRNLSEGPRVTLSDNPAHQILGNQKIYGLWGLYTVPGRASGLIDGDAARLTPPARTFVERHYLPLLAEGGGRDARRIRELLSQASVRLDLSGAATAMVSAIADVLTPSLSAEEREFYTSYLLRGGPQDGTAGRQQQLAELLRSTLEDSSFAWSPVVVGHLAKAAARRGQDWESLADQLSRIRTSESVLAPASTVFAYLLGLDGKPPGLASSRLKDAWGTGLRSVDAAAFAELQGEIGAGDGPTGARWADIAAALAAGEYSRLVDLLIAQNAVVMTQRGGVPWIERRAGHLHVRFRDEQGALPDRVELPWLWRFSYFLFAAERRSPTGADRTWLRSRTLCCPSTSRSACRGGACVRRCFSPTSSSRRSSNSRCCRCSSTCPSATPMPSGWSSSRTRCAAFLARSLSITTPTA